VAKNRQAMLAIRRVMQHEMSGILYMSRSTRQSVQPRLPADAGVAWLDDGGTRDASRKPALSDMPRQKETPHGPSQSLA
jgi:hypothetical protein